jgi:hypothetical protein
VTLGLGFLLGGNPATDLLRQKVGPKEVGAGASALAVPIGYGTFAGEEAFLSKLSLLVLGLGVAFAISYVNHVVAWGFRRSPQPEVEPRDLLCLDRLLWLQLPIVLAWLGFGTHLAFHPNATVPLLPLHVPWLSILTLSIIPGVLVTVVASSAKAQRCGLGLITESVRNSPPARSLEALITPLERVLMLTPLREWLRGKELSLVSGFSVFLISTLLFFGAETVYGIAGQRLLRHGIEKAFPDPRGPVVPTFEELCPGRGEPGRPAPKPWGEALYGLWLGESGAGAIEAGCTRPAHQAEGQPHIWVAEGVCEGSLRSFGISVKGRPPSLLYQQAARFALAKERDGMLIGASPRKNLRAGDFYLVQTEIGPYILIRPQKATGSTTESDAPRRCEDYTSDNYPYTAIPPGLIRLWLRISHWQLTWPVLDEGGESNPRSFAFIGAESGGLVADAECDGPTFCTASFNGQALSTPSAENLSLEAILRVLRGG